MKIPFLVIITALMIVCGCEEKMNTKHDSAQKPDSAGRVAAIMAAHTGELMAIRGVVGVYEGALEDGSHCIAVMVDTTGGDSSKKIPKDIEGIPVRIEHSGPIQPMNK
jgi:hypothetical protein